MSAQSLCYSLYYILKITHGDVHESACGFTSMLVFLRVFVCVSKCIVKCQPKQIESGRVHVYSC